MPRQQKPKIKCWDLECSSLNANGGFIICASIVTLPDEKVRTFRVDKYKDWKHDPWNDRDLVADLVDDLDDADMWVTYYGKRFDHPFLNTRIFYWRSRGHDISLLSNVPHVDLYDTAKRKLKLHSNRLQVVSDLLGHGEKTPLELPTWIKAAGGHRPSINYVVEHCERDALILARNYLDLRPLVPAHPHMGVLATGDRISCATCGSGVQKRGTYVTEASTRQRFQCTNPDCGRWGSAPYKNNNEGAREGGSRRNTPKTRG